MNWEGMGRKGGEGGEGGERGREEEGGVLCVFCWRAILELVTEEWGQTNKREDLHPILCICVLR